METLFLQKRNRERLVMVRERGGGALPYFSKSSSRDRHEWSHTDEHKSKAPVSVESNTKSCQEGAHPLQHQSEVVANALIDLIQVTEYKHTKIRNEKVFLILWVYQ